MSRAPKLRLSPVGLIEVVILSIVAAGALDCQAVRRFTDVRLVTSSGVVQGRIESADSVQLRLRTGNDFQTYRRADISAAFRPARSGKRGARVGAIVGAIAGTSLLLMAGTGAGDCYTRCHQTEDAWLAVGVGAVAGGGLGAGVGALVGSSRTRWVPVPDLNELYRRP